MDPLEVDAAELDDDAPPARLRAAADTADRDRDMVLLLETLLLAANLACLPVPSSSPALRLSALVLLLLDEATGPVRDRLELAPALLDWQIGLGFVIRDAVTLSALAVPRTLRLLRIVGGPGTNQSTQQKRVRVDRDRTNGWQAGRAKSDLRAKTARIIPAP
jgi:hypothetical protein